MSTKHPKLDLRKNKRLKNNSHMLTDIKIKVPGTSANLGPGFDLLGMALEIYNEFFFQFDRDSSYKILLLNGFPPPFEIKENLIKGAYQTYNQIFLPGVELPAFDVRVNFNLPMRGGLGSSASAVVAGFMAAKSYHERHIPSIPLPDENSILTELALIEGHPDNSTPALLGGFIFSYFTENGLVYFKKKFPDSIKLFLFIPELETDTNASRKKLPESYTTEDVVFNMSRICTWLEFLNSGKANLLALSIADKIHTPYRINNIPLLKEISEILLHHKISFTLSGSGPTLLLFEKQEKSHEFTNYFHQIAGECLKHHAVKFKLMPINPCENGTEIIKEWR